LARKASRYNFNAKASAGSLPRYYRRKDADFWDDA
jgi:hypothetical protein